MPANQHLLMIGITSPSPWRVQWTRRTKNANAIYCGQPTIFANPWIDYDRHRRGHCLFAYRDFLEHVLSGVFYARTIEAVHVVRRVHHKPIVEWEALRAAIMPVGNNQLTGRKLSCWCPLDQLCHVDLLAAVANGWRSR